VTLWYALTSTNHSLGFGGMLLFLVHGRLISQVDRELRDDFEMVESRVARDSAGNLRWPGFVMTKMRLNGKNKLVRVRNHISAV